MRDKCDDHDVISGQYKLRSSGSLTSTLESLTPTTTTSDDDDNDLYEARDHAGDNALVGGGAMDGKQGEGSDNDELESDSEEGSDDDDDDGEEEGSEEDEEDEDEDLGVEDGEDPRDVIEEEG
jgi:hypothetical protein